MAVEQVPDAFGPYSQIAGAVTVIVGIVYAVFRGLKDRGRADLPLPSEQRWFFDGPLAEALRCLREDAEATKLILAELRPIGEAIRIQNRLLEDVKRGLDNLRHRREE